MKAKQTTKRSQFKKQFRRHIKLALVPHKANQYRPHLIRRFGLVGMLVFIIAVQAVYNFSTTGMVLGEKASITAEDLLADTNSERARYQLAPLEVDSKLSQAAFLKAQDMFQKQYWAHTAPDGATSWQWFSEVGYNYTYAGENLAKNFRTADAVTTAWMASPEHQANVLGAHYSQVGFAVVDGMLQGKPATLVVALYGAPATATPAVAPVSTNAPASHSVGLLTRLGVAVQSVTPAVLGSIVLVLIATGVAFVAHVYRNKLPAQLRRSWYRHHGLIKVGGMLSFMVMLLFLYSGGQI